jgi:hypothetical protein
MSATQGNQLPILPAEEPDTRSIRQKLRPWLLGVVKESPPPAAEPALEPVPGRIGICCSGGGLRSAAYNLGALQALRDQDVLGKADYLTAVSGGSYIAAAHFITAASSNPRLFTKTPLFSRSSPEEQYLRSHTDYLAPGLGGKLTLILRLLAGLTITTVLLLLSLEVVARLLGWAYGNGLQLHHGGRNSLTLHITAGVWAVVVGLAVAAVTTLIIRLLFRLPDAAARFLAAWGFRALFAATIIFVLLIGLPWIVVALRHLPTAAQGTQRLSRLIQAFRTNSALTSAAGLGSFLSVGFGALRALVAKRRSWIAMLVGALVAPLALLTYFLVRVNAIALIGFTWPQVAVVLGVLVVLAFVYWQADLTQWSMHPTYRERLSSAFALKRLHIKDQPTKDQPTSEEPNWRTLVGAVTGPLLSAAIVAVGLSGWGWIDSWSTRLVLIAVPVGLIVGQRLTPRRAGVARRAVDPEVDPAPGVDPNLFAEEVPFEQRLPLPAMNPPTAQQLGLPKQLVVCAAANVSDRGSTPTGRGGASFTFDAEQIGGPVVGFVKTDTFEKAVGDRVRDLTLPAAVAMSGAAVSPSMGKMTRRPLTFLLALANVRLGVWLPNPRRMKEHEETTKIMTSGPDKPSENGRGQMATIGQKVIGLTPRAHYLVKELLGRNHLNDKYLYVTDGGHYENLGLVELLRRGCTTIYCFDAAGDHVDTFNTLGSAIEIARVDLNVEVQLDPPTAFLPVKEGVKASRLSRTAPKLSPNDHLVGDVVYHRPDGSTVRGAIVYAKAAVVADAPWDVRAFQQRNPVFPNHSTALQLFDEATFEAYRALGEFTARHAANDLATYLDKQPMKDGSAPSPGGPVAPRWRWRLRVTRALNLRVRVAHNALPPTE